MTPNPFEFEAANKFTPKEMVQYFIDDYNFARFVYSRKNVFLLGDCGTGKTMFLRFYSLPIQNVARKDTETGRNDLLRLIGIYVPCRKPALKKTEPDMLDPFLGRIMAEHLMVVAMITALADSLQVVPEVLKTKESEQLRREIMFVLQWQLPDNVPLFRALSLAAQRQSRDAQSALNRRIPDGHYENAVSFATAFQPLIEVMVSNLSMLKESHFSIMFDDADDLSDLQNEALNTWIATRDTSRISFKVATSKVDQKSLKTISGDGLLERHDYIRVDMEQGFQNSDALYGKLVRRIVDKRLSTFGFSKNADQFFPINQQMADDLKAAREKALKEAEDKYPAKDPDQIRHYVYKMERAIYFRERGPKANRPPYSGFDLLVHVSTGVIRYLLEPCYNMYDTALSQADNDKTKIQYIEPSIQAAHLEAMSKRRWEWIRAGFNNNVRGCTREDAQHIYQLADKMAHLFKSRLHNHLSEPRAITFSISAAQSFNKARLEELERVLRIARRAQILFMRPSTAKEEGRQDDYYTFDRLLWIDRGLDPVGQNARVSIEARFLWDAAFENKPIPTRLSEKKDRAKESVAHLDLFEELEQ